VSFRFLHLADLHLETHFGGKHPWTRERLREATREAFSRACDYALERGVHAVLAAGDLFDDPLLSLRTELFLVREVRRLTEAGTWFLYACGNHDPGHHGARASGLQLERGDEPWRSRVRVFRGAEPRVVDVTDRNGRRVGRVVGAGHETAAEGENLAARFPELPRELPTVGLLHTQVDGARQAAEHARYAPSRPEDFRRGGYGYWALGHVHLRQRAAPGVPAWYPGNLQGRNPRESGEKGGLEVELAPHAEAEPRFVRLAPVRWALLDRGDLGEVTTLEALADLLARRIEEERSGREELVVCLDLQGPSPLRGRLAATGALSELEADLAERTGTLEVQVRARALAPAVDEAALRASPSVLARALELLDEARRDPAALRALAPDVLAGASGLGEGEQRERYLRALLEDLETELVGASLAEGER
jgi:DNA repair exonuclease SbcCD nuclease subunit